MNHELPRRLRSALRSIAGLVLAVAVVTCVDSPTGPTAGTASSASSGRASLALAPHFAPSAAEAAAVFDANGFVVNQVQVVVTVPGATPPLLDTLADTTIAYSSADPPSSLSLSIAVDPGAQVSFSINYLSGTTVLYNATGTTTTIPVGSTPPANPTSPVLVPVGPGATASQILVSPVSGSFSTAAAIQFAATVADANGNPITGALLTWAVSDQSIATVGAGTGLLQPTGKRGSVTVTATTLDGISGQSTISLVPPPAKLVLVSGGGQTGFAGTALTQPVQVQLQATDQVGVAGQIVTFSVSGGTAGSASPTTAATDVNGNAQTTITLGTTPGQYTVTAASNGFSATATETANATTVASLVPVSGSGQTDSVKQQLPAALVVKAADQFGNPKSGVTVTWARTAGSGTLSATTTTTASDGTASITYTFGSTVGTETVTATATGVTQPVTFSETATTGAAAAVHVTPKAAFMSYFGATQQFSATVTDANGLAVSGSTVVWSSTNSGVVSVSASGLGTAVATGQALIVASSGRAADTATVFVSQTAILAVISPSGTADTVAVAATLQLTVQAIDAGGHTIANAGAGTWSSSASGVASVSNAGLVTGVSGGTATITAVISGLTAHQTIVVPAGGGGTSLTLNVSSAEKLPNGTQQFSVTAGPAGPYTWLVNNVVGGNATFGTINTSGFYTAPASQPNPSTFNVCAEVTAAPTETGCASVTIDPVPTAGGDVIVYNDYNPFDNTAALDPNNQLFYRNLVNFTGTGPRASQTKVMMYEGHGSQDGLWSTVTTMRSVIAGAGYTVIDSSSNLNNPIDAGVKTMFLWLPTIAFSDTEINTLKSFSAQGGRIVWVGEYQGFYSGIPAENAFFVSMGALMQNVGGAYDCGYTVLPASSLRASEITAGMTDITMACGSAVQPGPNDYPLIYSLQSPGTVLAAVAKVDVTPLALSVTRGARPAAARINPVPGSTTPTSNDPTGAALRKPPGVVKPPAPDFYYY